MDAAGWSAGNQRRIPEPGYHGVDHFIYYASLGLGLKEQKRSLELFIEKVIPQFDHTD